MEIFVKYKKKTNPDIIFKDKYYEVRIKRCKTRTRRSKPDSSSKFSLELPLDMWYESGRTKV